jgi:O-methyltransferase
MRIADHVKRNVISGVNLVLKPFGRSAVITQVTNPKDLSDADVDIKQYEDLDIIRQVLPYTLTTPARLFVLIEAVKYVINNDIEGDIVECGVWKGGSMMAVALALLKMNASDRDLYLYDTFKGMTPPSEEDVTFRGDTADAEYSNRVKRKALEVYPRALKSEDENDASNWCYSPLEEVRNNMSSLGYPHDRIFLVQGKVEDTIPQQMPAGISILRLDTDFYESTKHELEHLFPRVSHGGVLIIDDYGIWMGQKKAVDEYVREHGTKIFLNRVDFACRIGVKMD